MFEINTLKQEIINAGRRLYLRGLVAASDGNISCRLSDGSFLITASGFSKGFLSPEDILRIDAKGSLLESTDSRKPSIETEMHLAVYRMRPELTAIIHAHPPYATAFALIGRDLCEGAPDEVKLQLGKVAMLPYAEAGSKKLASVCAAGLHDANAALLARHGTLTVGESLTQALYRMEALEQSAKIMAIAAQLSRVE